MWKQKYHKSYFNETYELRDTLGASILKYDNFPKSLFKYTKAEHGIKSLKDDYIKVSTPFEANDPFEGDLLFEYDLLSQHYKTDLLIKQLDAPEFNLSKRDKETITNSKNPLDKLIELLYENEFYLSDGLNFKDFKKKFIEGYTDFEHYTVRNFNKELKKQILFISLSECNNINPMWAHYADNHKGICIEYNLSSENSLLDEPCHPICYVDHADYSEEINQLDNDKRNKLKVLEEPFLKKSIDWNYEKEWRILFNKTQIKAIMEHLKFSEFIEKRNKLCFMKFPKPTSVFLGLKISNENQTKIKKICNEREINVYKMVKDESRYNLNFIEI